MPSRTPVSHLWRPQTLRFVADLIKERGNDRKPRSCVHVETLTSNQERPQDRVRGPRERGSRREVNTSPVTRPGFGSNATEAPLPSEPGTVRSLDQRPRRNMKGADRAADAVAEVGGHTLTGPSRY